MKLPASLILSFLVFGSGCAHRREGVVGNWINNDTITDGNQVAKQTTTVEFRDNGSMLETMDIQVDKVHTKITIDGTYTLSGSNILMKVKSSILEGNYLQRRDMVKETPQAFQNPIPIPYSWKTGQLTMQGAKGNKMTFRPIR